MNENTDVAALIRRTNELLTVLAKTQLSAVIESELADAVKRKLYEYTGSLGVKALTTKVGMSAGTISGHWKRWEQLGLLVKEGQSYRRLFS